MKRLLLLLTLATAVLVLVPVATAAPAAKHTLNGTVVAKDRAHRALVVALPGGKVQTIAAPSAFGRTSIGRKVTISYTALPGRLPVALSVSLKSRMRTALVRGTMVRLVRRHAIINAGGSVLNVTLKAPKRQRTLASAQHGPRAGDTVKVKVEIDNNGALAAGAVVVTGAPAGVTAGSEGEMEVRGKVAPGLVLATSTTPGTITLQTSAVDVTCVIPIGSTFTAAVGDMIELQCDLIGGTWTVRVGHAEDDPADDDDDDDAGKVKVRGILTTLTDQAVTVGAVSCAIPASVLEQVKAKFAVNDVVKMKCVKIGDTLTLKEIEKKGDSSGPSGDDDDDDDDDGGNSGSDDGSGDDD